jgi:hypothetical protein
MKEVANETSKMKERNRMKEKGMEKGKVSKR